MLYGQKSVLLIWNKMWESKWWQNFNFWLNCPFTCIFDRYGGNEQSIIIWNIQMEIKSTITSFQRLRPWIVSFWCKPHIVMLFESLAQSQEHAISRQKMFNTLNNAMPQLSSALFWKLYFSVEPPQSVQGCDCHILTKGTPGGDPQANSASQEQITWLLRWKRRLQLCSSHKALV